MEVTGAAGRMRIVRVAGLLALLVALAAGVASPVRAADGPSLNVIELSTLNYPTVKVTFETLDADGLPVTGLGRTDFAVYENGEPQTIVSGYALASSSQPLDVMLVLDTSLSMRDDDKLGQAQAAATAFVSQMRSIDRVGLIQFDTQLSEVSPFTGNRTVLTQRIGELTAQGNTRIFDALVLALTKTAATDGSKAVVLMTDGQDTESGARLEQVLGLINDTDIRVYTIGIGGDVDQGVLREIAQVSGGHFYAAPTAADIGEAFRLMSNQLRNRYQVVYSSPATAAVGTTMELRLTAQTPQGLASSEVSYVVPAFIPPSQPAQAQTSQPWLVRMATAAFGEHSDYAAAGLTALGFMLATGGLAFRRAQRAHHSRLAFFVDGATRGMAGGGAEVGAEGGSSLIGTLLAPVVPLARLFVGLIARLLPPAQVQRYSHLLALAGHPFGWRVSHFVAARCLLGLGAATLTGFFMLGAENPLRGVVLVAAFGFLGYRLPVAWLKRRIKSRQKQLLRALPDALDLLTICVEAGLGLDGAMLEVINRWDNALSKEFAVVLAELKMGRSRHDALRALADRTGLQEVKVFVSTMIQADELGMGIARPLALQAEQLRLKRRQRAEKASREAGIKMVVTMGVLIMPALILIIAAPAVQQVSTLFRVH